MIYILPMKKGMRVSPSIISIKKGLSILIVGGTDMGISYRVVVPAASVPFSFIVRTMGYPDKKQKKSVWGSEGKTNHSVSRALYSSELI